MLIVKGIGALTGESASSSHAARIGEGVNTDPGTEIRGFSFCDTSIISEPRGLPPVLKVISFKRLASKLAATL